jgi:Lactate dehydrogenase and related dehydrogenases
VWVANTPGANASSVAEIAVGLMLETVRKMPAARDYLNQLTGKMYPSYLVSHSLGSRTVGLVGYGNIAKATEQMVAGFGAKILVTARHPHTPKYGQFVDLATLLAESDVVSLHLPATAETTGLFDRQLFAQMKTDAILINTSRGSLVNETDLVAAIDGGIIGGAGLDTTGMEPVPAQSPLLAHERIVLLPHIGGFTIEAEVKTAHMVAQNCIDLFEERTPRFALN